MKNAMRSTKPNLMSSVAPMFGTAPNNRSRKGIFLSNEVLAEILERVYAKINEGLSNAAEKIITQTLVTYSQTLETKARLFQVLSFVQETQGRYAESLESLTDFENEEILSQLNPAVRVPLITQLALGYNNTNDFPKAVALLNTNLEEAEKNSLNENFAAIYVAFSRVYRKLNECEIGRDHAEKSLNYARLSGDWSGMAEAYREIGNNYRQGGNSEKSIDYYQQAIKLVGEHSAPFLLGKLYSEISGAYWSLRRPQDGIDCLEKSIDFFEKTEHKVQAIAAYNNLGINLMLLGNWAKAEAAIRRALEIAFEVNHAHLAGIMDSLGELKLFRGDFAEAEKLFTKAIAIAEERKKEYYAIQSLKNLALCFLTQGKPYEAIAKAQETIARCKKINEKQFRNLASLVLAESYLKINQSQESEEQLCIIEATDPTSDFFVLGNIQRIRGLQALANEDEELAFHHLSRSLSIFETAGDLYQTALANYEIGKAIADSRPDQAAKHLNSAIEVFRKLETNPSLILAEEVLATVNKFDTTKKRESSVNSQLLTLRLAEASISRELVFRELVAILQQESRAKKIIVADLNEENKLYPFISQGFTPAESAKVLENLEQAQANQVLDSFSKENNLAVFPFRAANAVSAVLILHPKTAVNLANGISLQPLLRVVELGLEVCALRDKDRGNKNFSETQTLPDHSLLAGFIHSSPAMTKVVDEIYKIRSSDVTVLVTGESGTGKELVSRAVHMVSARKDKAFIPFNCTTVPKDLAEGQLFGYRKGSFTGAVYDSPGVIRSADGGTLFLDEVGDLPLDVQPKLLRFLQEGEIHPLGEKKPLKVDVRIITATNKPLEKMVEEGTFREDLYYRLNVIRLRVPPLRERRSEIVPMVTYYVNHFSQRFHKRDITITTETLDLLMVCNWAGNARQLCNEIQRIVARSDDGEVITPESLSPELKRSAVPIPSLSGKSSVFSDAYSSSLITETEGETIEAAVSGLETQMIISAMKRHGNNISRVAKELGLTRRGLYMKIERYQIAKTA